MSQIEKLVHAMSMLGLPVEAINLDFLSRDERQEFRSMCRVYSVGSGDEAEMRRRADMTSTGRLL